MFHVDIKISVQITIFRHDFIFVLFGTPFVYKVQCLNTTDKVLQLVKKSKSKSFIATLETRARMFDTVLINATI